MTILSTAALGLRRIVVAGLIVAGGALFALVLARLVENSMIFFPARYPAGEWDPERPGVGAQEFSFRTADGLLLHGWWFATPSGADNATPSGADTAPSSGAANAPEAEAEPPVLLWAHGNGGNLTDRAMHARALAQQGLEVFIFDYRGYGKSEGSPDEPGIYRDAEAAYAFLTGDRGVSPERIVLLGRSLGTAPAARLATRVPHAGTVLVSPLPSAKRMARRMFGGLPVDLLIRSRFPVLDWVAQRDTPLLVIHGDRDEVIPVSFGREVFEAAAEPKQFVLLPGAGHNDILMVSGHDYLDPLARFAKAAVVAARARSVATR